MKIHADEFLSYLVDSIIQPIYTRLEAMSKEVEGLKAAVAANTSAQDAADVAAVAQAVAANTNAITAALAAETAVQPASN